MMDRNRKKLYILCIGIVIAIFLIGVPYLRGKENAVQPRLYGSEAKNDSQESAYLSCVKEMLYKAQNDTHVILFETAYQLLNRNLFGSDTVMEWLDDDLKQEILLYAEEVKGEFTEVQDEESIFPAELISIMENMIYQSFDDSLQKILWEEVQESIYFETMNALGAEKYSPDLEEMKRLFPELKNVELRDVYEAYKIISGYEHCEEIYHYHTTDGQDNYIFVVNSGGSMGLVEVLLMERKNGEFIMKDEFVTPNSGYNRVIRFAGDFYYIYLQRNYNLKNYDGVRIYKLGDNPKEENVKVQYLPYSYVWKNIYNTREGEALETYLEGIKEMLTSDEYLETGKEKDMGVFFGDEEKTEDITVPENDHYYMNTYHKADFANIGIPVYMRKSNLVPSTYRDTWHIRCKFYMQNPVDASVVTLEELEIDDDLLWEIDMVQMWFKEMEGNVYTCCLYHVSDYNYVLNIFLMEGDEIRRIRTDIFCPQRRFVLTEGEVFWCG